MILQHTFLQSAVTAFIGNFYTRMKPFANALNADVPVLISNTGDEAYLSRMYAETAENYTNLYSKLPRIVASPGSIRASSDALTNPHVTGEFIGVDRNTEISKAYIAPVKRLSVEHQISMRCYLANIFQYYIFAEIYMTVMHRVNQYSFEYAGKRHRGEYTIDIDFDADTNFDLPLDNSTRNRIIDFSVELNLEYPAFQIYKEQQGVNYNSDADSYSDDAVLANDNSVLDASNAIQQVIHNTDPQNCERVDDTQTIVIPQEDEFC